MDTVIPFNFQESLSLADLGDLLGRMRDTYYDAVIALSRDPLLRFFLWLSGIPKRVGYVGPASLFLTNTTNANSHTYQADAYLELLASFDLDLQPASPAVRLRKGDLAWAAAERARYLGDGDRDYILLFPGQGGYPSHSWAEIARVFMEKRPELAVIVASTPKNSAQAAAIKADLSTIPLLAPANIGQLAATIAGASLVLCPDNAAMQLAVATQTPLVGLFSTSEPTRRLPADGPFRFVNSPTGNLADIKPEAVVATIFP